MLCHEKVRSFFSEHRLNFISLKKQFRACKICAIYSALAIITVTANLVEKL